MLTLSRVIFTFYSTTELNYEQVNGQGSPPSHEEVLFINFSSNSALGLFGRHLEDSFGQLREIALLILLVRKKNYSKTNDNINRLNGQEADPCVSKILQYLQMDHMVSAMKSPNEEDAHICKKRPPYISSPFSSFYRVPLSFDIYSLPLKIPFENDYYGQNFFYIKSTFSPLIHSDSFILQHFYDDYNAKQIERENLNTDLHGFVN